MAFTLYEQDYAIGYLWVDIQPQCLRDQDRLRYKSHRSSRGQTVCQKTDKNLATQDML